MKKLKFWSHSCFWVGRKQVTIAAYNKKHACELALTYIGYRLLNSEINNFFNEGNHSNIKTEEILEPCVIFDGKILKRYTKITSL